MGAAVRCPCHQERLGSGGGAPGLVGLDVEVFTAFAGMDLQEVGLTDPELWSPQVSTPSGCHRSPQVKRRLFDEIGSVLRAENDQDSPEQALQPLAFDLGLQTPSPEPPAPLLQQPWGSAEPSPVAARLPVPLEALSSLSGGGGGSLQHGWLSIGGCALHEDRSDAFNIACTKAALKPELHQIQHFCEFARALPFHPCAATSPEGHPIATYGVDHARLCLLENVDLAKSMQLLRGVDLETRSSLGSITVFDLTGLQLRHAGRLWRSVLKPLLVHNIRCCAECEHNMFIVNVPRLLLPFFYLAVELWLNPWMRSKVTVSSKLPASLLALVGREALPTPCGKLGILRSSYSVRAGPLGGA